MLIVGAKQEGDKGYIYFIDPDEASDPKSAARRIYMISYRNFQESVCNVRGELVARSSHPYAYRGQFIKTVS